MLRRTLLCLGLALAAAPVAAQTPPAQGRLQPIRPQTALEQAFIAAYRSEAARPAFREQFLESNVLLVMESDARDAEPRLTDVPGGRTAMIFTSAELLNRRLGPATPRTAMNGRAALMRVRQNHVVINAGYEPMLVLDPAGIDGFLGIPASPEAAGPSQ
ncbi:MAG TPA: SseB family protein [Vitreimonas sp.]|uniref:SseB family protein n=1 Tax=Vitreimonas sp. TaxID=3069702 RepID=UPI002D4EB68A|nr:SseB family protein [Vitreimonas sp.]HYD86985.1 SseB family protein [Vitreimonas sp.]